MALAAGVRLGPYEIHSAIGAGGMGEVWRGRDTTLGRDVALKILPDHLALDPDRLARFKREAQILASLNHPNIATIYGFQESDGVQALVLELVEGPTLADRIALGPIPIDEALPVAKQITEALEAAHEQGIVHRDLKPANIKLRPDGTVKVLDFGLAKVLETTTHPTDATQSPTITSPAMTDTGVILGTAAYMSPEQARGKSVDKRTDVWAFGCVLYEMLTGRQVFSGETTSDTIAAILEREPNWSVLPTHAPTEIHRLLRRCLDKDSRRRLRDIGEARIEMEDDPARRVSASGIIDGHGRESGHHVPSWMLAAAGLVFVGSVVAVLWVLSRGRSERPPDMTRTTVTLNATQELDTEAGAYPLAFSPDGRRLVYAARSQGRAQLYLRNLDAFDATPLEGTEDAQYPFFSPDGQWVGFFADRKLKRISVAGGAPVPVCDVPAVERGGSWGADGTIVFDPVGPGLMRVSAAGGIPQPLTSQDASIDALSLSWPRFLPDGRGLLVTVAGLPKQPGSVLGVLSVDTGAWHLLGRGSQAQYSPSGHLIYHAGGVREGQLDAVSFDIEKLVIQGEPTAVLDGVFRSRGGGGAYFVVGSTGALVFAPGGLAHTLTRVDRDGRRTPLTEDRRGFRFPRISPDGRQVAVTIDPRPSEIWVYDIIRGSKSPLATGAHSLVPVWTRNGKHVTYTTGGDLHWRAADGSSAAERLFSRSGAQYGSSWSSDDRLLSFHDEGPTNGSDIWVFSSNGDAHPLLATPANEMNAMFSPDGRWIAYSSDESGRNEIYVRRYPNVDAGKWIVSTTGGHSPHWSPNGRELYYLNGSAVTTVSVATESTVFTAGKPTVLFTGPFDTTQDNNYDISPDGTYFVMVEADPDTRPTRLHVVLNWFEELERLVPTK